MRAGGSSRRYAVPVEMDVANVTNCDTSHYMENKGRMVRLAESAVIA